MAQYPQDPVIQYGIQKWNRAIPASPPPKLLKQTRPKMATRSLQRKPAQNRTKTRRSKKEEEDAPQESQRKHRATAYRDEPIEQEAVDGGDERSAYQPPPSSATRSGRRGTTPSAPPPCASLRPSPRSGPGAPPRRLLEASIRYQRAAWGGRGEREGRGLNSKLWGAAVGPARGG